MWDVCSSHVLYVSGRCHTGILQKVRPHDLWMSWTSPSTVRFTLREERWTKFDRCAWKARVCNTPTPQHIFLSVQFVPSQMQMILCVLSLHSHTTWCSEWLPVSPPLPWFFKMTLLGFRGFRWLSCELMLLLPVPVTFVITTNTLHARNSMSPIKIILSLSISCLFVLMMYHKHPPSIVPLALIYYFNSCRDSIIGMNIMYFTSCSLMDI